VGPRKRKRIPIFTQKNVLFASFIIFLTSQTKAIAIKINVKKGNFNKGIIVYNYTILKIIFEVLFKYHQSSEHSNLINFF